jgi:hypothetical protein
VIVMAASAIMEAASCIELEENASALGEACRHFSE